MSYSLPIIRWEEEDLCWNGLFHQDYREKDVQFYNVQFILMKSFPVFDSQFVLRFFSDYKLYLSVH